MKTGKLKAIWILAGISFILAVLEGLFFYANVTPLFLPLMLVLYNAIRAFLMNPAISLNHIWEQLKQGMGPVETAVAYAYSLALFFAFLCTATAVFTTLRYLFQKTALSARAKNAEHIFIFGSNENVRTLLKNFAAQAKKGERPKSAEHPKVLHVVTGSDIPANQETSLLKAGIVFHQGDILAMPDRQRQHFLQSAGFPQDGKAILMEDSITKNISLCLAIRNSQFLNAQFYLSGKSESFQWLMEGAADQTKETGLSKKGIKLFSIPELRVRDMFREKPLYSYNVQRLSSPGEVPDWNVHMLIVGLGRTGKEILQQTIEMGVITGDNRILIDVIDRAAMEQMSMFQSVFHPAYLRSGSPEGELEISAPQADGQLRIRFHQMDIRANGFRKILEAITEDEPLTYITLCTRDPDLTLYCMSQVQHFLFGKRLPSPPLVVRMEQQGMLTSFLGRELGSFPNVFLMEGSDSILTLDRILDPRVEEQSILCHSRYDQISTLMESRKIKERIPSYEQLCELKPIDQDLTDILKNWSNLPYRKQESSRHMCYHDPVKVLYLSWMVWNASGEGTFADYLDQSRDLSSALHALLAEARPSDQAAFLEALARTEHRRWCYFSALRGWGTSPEGETKSEDLRLNPCMTCWEQLCRRRPDMCIYDLIPLCNLLA